MKVFDSQTTISADAHGILEREQSISYTESSITDTLKSLQGSEGVSSLFLRFITRWVTFMIFWIRDHTNRCPVWLVF